MRCGKGEKKGGQENSIAGVAIFEPSLLLPGCRTREIRGGGDAWCLARREKKARLQAMSGRSQPTLAPNCSQSLAVGQTDGRCTSCSSHARLADWQTGRPGGPHEPSHKGGRKARPGIPASRRKIPDGPPQS